MFDVAVEILWNDSRDDTNIPTIEKMLKEGELISIHTGMKLRRCYFTEFEAHRKNSVLYAGCIIFITGV